MAAYGGPPTQTPPGAPNNAYAPRPQISFDVIGEAWRLFQAQMGTWIAAVFIFCAVIGLAYAVMIVVMIGPMMAAAGTRNQGVALGSMLFSYLLQIVLSIGLATLIMMMMGGLYRMAVKQLRGESISVGDMFSVTDVFVPLVIASLLVGITINIGSMLCILPGLVAGGLLMFTLPLVVDQRLSPINAMSQSFNLLKADWLMASLFYFVASLIGGIGFLFCGLGGFFTFPVFILSVAITYRNYMMGGAVPAMPGGYPPTVPGAYTPPAAYPTVQTPAPPSAYTPATPQTQYPQPTQAAPMPGYEPTTQVPPANDLNNPTQAMPPQYAPPPNNPNDPNNPQR